MLTIEQLQKVASMLIKAYRAEIIKDGDWWFGIDDYDFNIHDSGDEQGLHPEVIGQRADGE
jgi:hypothetical protein